ncbi:MAG: amidohydrolase family protein [Planctomycetota bacterium]|jgi:imidazolonepropionase-like amidohydrolase
MKGIKGIFVLASLILPFLSAGAFSAQQVAIKAGTILPISGAPIENGTILIKDGKIAALGRNIAVGADVRVIDAGGKFVMPGMIDAQSRLFVIDSELNESRSIAPELNILDGLDPFIKEAPEVAAQGVTAVYISPGSRGLIGGGGAVLKLNGSKDAGKMLLKGEVAIKGAVGVSSNNVSSSLVRLANYSSIREALLETKIYMHNREKHTREQAEYDKKKAEYDKKKETRPAEKAEKPKRPARFRPNPTREVLAKVLSKEIPLQIEAHRVTDILNVLRLADEFGFVLILDKCTEGYLVAGEIARRKATVILGPVSASFADMPRLEYRNHNIRNAAILSEKGVKLALGVSGRDGASSKFVALAAAMAAGGGMDRNLALRAVTLTPAEILGVADRIGSLEEGKDADIVILTGHPLDMSSRVEMVLIEGKTVFERKDQQ